LVVFALVITGCSQVSEDGHVANPQTEGLAASIAVLSPNGGGILEVGSTQIISWETQDIQSYPNISIHIKRMPPSPFPEEGQEFDPIVFVGIENDGSEEWVISNMYPEGRYVLEVVGYSDLPLVEGNYISDESDSIFNIVNSK